MRFIGDATIDVVNVAKIQHVTLMWNDGLTGMNRTITGKIFGDGRLIEIFLVGRWFERQIQLVGEHEAFVGRSRTREKPTQYQDISIEIRSMIVSNDLIDVDQVAVGNNRSGTDAFFRLGKISVTLNGT